MFGYVVNFGFEQGKNGNGEINKQFKKWGIRMVVVSLKEVDRFVKIQEEVYDLVIYLLWGDGEGSIKDNF